MYKILITAMITLICYTSADAGDVVDTTIEALKANEQQMVRLGIPKEDALTLSRMMVESHFQEQHAIHVQRLLIETVESNLPYEPLLNKAFEGIAKKIAPEKIVQAMSKTQTRYATAYNLASQVVKSKAKAKQIGDILADGLAAGMHIHDSSRVMEAVRQAVQHMTRTQAEDLTLQTALTARSMSRLGVSSQATADIACRALAKGYSSQEMEQLQHTFTRQAAHKSSQRLAAQFSRAIQSGARPGGSRGGFGGSSGGRGGRSGGGSGSPGGGQAVRAVAQAVRVVAQAVRVVAQAVRVVAQAVRVAPVASNLPICR